MRCKWCPYLATESVKSDGKTRELFDDLKWHVHRHHPSEYRQFERRAWGSAMETGRKVKKLRDQQKLLE